jgi:hypothetical protein
MGAISSVQLNSVLWCLIFLVLSMAPRILRWLLDIRRFCVSISDASLSGVTLALHGVMSSGTPNNVSTNEDSREKL